MRFIMQFTIPNDTGNDAFRDSKFAEKMQGLLKEVKAGPAIEAAVRTYAT